jgi:hypothetical protein
VVDGPSRRRAGVVRGVPLLFAISVVLVNVETPRFREPVEPFLIMLAACALAAAAGRLRRSPVRRGLDTAPSAGSTEPVEVI